MEDRIEMVKSARSQFFRMICFGMFICISLCINEISSCMAQSAKNPDKVVDKSNNSMDMAADPSQAAKKTEESTVRQNQFWQHPATNLRSYVSIDVGQELGPVNRNVLGACVMWPAKEMIHGKREIVPYSTQAIDAVKPFLTGGSVRLWNRTTPGWTNWWLDFINHVKPERCYIFFDGVAHPKEQIYYKSIDDHNLFGHQTPDAFAQRVKQINRSSYKNHPDGIGIQYWELWNEPRFSQNGGWPAIDHARFCLDAARKMKEVDPTIKVGPHIYGDVNDQWNQDFLRYLSENGRDLIDFVVNHYYDTKWFQQWDIYGSYLGRVAYATEVRKMVKNDRAAVDHYGQGKWELVCTEWNTHPQRYDWPGEPTRDLAVALFQASTLQAFIEEGMDAAQVFALNSGSFGLFQGREAEEKWPTYYVFKMFGDHMRGNRIRSNVISPGFVWNWEIKDKQGQPRVVPYVTVTACVNGDQINLMVVNKHPDNKIDLIPQFHNLSKTVMGINVSVLSGDNSEAIVPKIHAQQLQPDTDLIITLPAHSLSAIQIKLSQ